MGCAVASNGSVMLPIIFPASQSVDSNAYRDLVLTKLKEWMAETFEPGTAVFQQNGAPAHTSNVTQQWMKANLANHVKVPKHIKDSSNDR